MAHKHGQGSTHCQGSITDMFGAQDGSWVGHESHTCDVRSYLDFCFFKFHSWEFDKKKKVTLGVWDMDTCCNFSVL